MLLLNGFNLFRLLKANAVSIPQCYTSYLSPISSQKLFNEVRCLVPKERHKSQESPFETPYVVRIHNHHELAEPKEVFTFCHPNWKLSSENAAAQFFMSDEEWGKKFEFKSVSFNCENSEEKSSGNEKKEDNMELSSENLKNGNDGKKIDINNNEHNRRHKTLKFKINHDTTMHGFAGYFRCSLYKDVEISIEPNTHSPGMFSWFPIFFPLKSPMCLNSGSDLEVDFWRCCNDQKVWYEWVVTSPTPCEIHNPKGRSYIIGL